MPFVPHSPPYASQVRPKLMPAEFDRTQVALQDATALAEAAVPKGTLTFNVKDYGAICDWTGTFVTPAVGTVNNAAIDAALADAAASITVGASTTIHAARVLVPAGPGYGYVINDTITVPANVSLQMETTFVYDGPSGRPAIVVGSSARSFFQNHKIDVARSTQSDWTSESDVGLLARNLYYSKLEVVRSNLFTIGCVILGDNANGFTYNEVRIGRLQDNKIAIDLTNDTAGWCNENLYIGGSFGQSSGTHLDMQRIAIRSTCRAATKVLNSANLFMKPSFELNGLNATGGSIIMQMIWGRANQVIGARSEGNSPEVMTQGNTSQYNWMDLAISYPAPSTFTNTSDNPTGGITSNYTKDVERATRVIRKMELRKNACYYDATGAVNIPGVVLAANSTSITDAQFLAASIATIAADYVELTTQGVIGFYMSTRRLKRFAVFQDNEVGFGGRYLVRCYDSSGTQITTAGTVTKIGTAMPYTTSYGGAFRTPPGTPGDPEIPGMFGVTAATDYVFIGVTAYATALRIRSLSVAAQDTFDVETWTGFKDYGKNYGTSTPAAGTWEVGREIVNAVPAAGQIRGWVCSVAGTPGTWLSTGSYTNVIGGKSVPEGITAAPVGTMYLRASAGGVGEIYIKASGSGNTGWLLASTTTPSGPATIVTDDFNRANSTTTLGSAVTGQAWFAPIGTWGVLSNLAYCPAHAGNERVYLDAGASDVIVTVKIAGSNALGLFARVAVIATGPNFSSGFFTSNTGLFWNDGTTSTSLATWTAYTTGDTVRMDMRGSTIKVLIDTGTIGSFTLVATVTDTRNLLETRHGLRMSTDSGGVNRFDNFVIQEY